jgi:hypothetical protein
MPKRPLTNLSMWALEDTFAALLEMERQLAPLMNNPNPTRTELITTLARVRVIAANARARITEAHPKVRQKVIARRP